MRRFGATLGAGLPDDAELLRRREVDPGSVIHGAAMEIIVQSMSVLISLGLVAVLLSGPDGANPPKA